MALSLLVAALWGLAEATLFFIVPDVWLTIVAARRGIRVAMLACLVAALGAVAGGAILYLVAAADAAGALALIERVPGIAPAMVERVGASLRAEGLVAMVLGAFAGVPYKIYAVQAPAAGIDLALFLLASLPARLARFLLLAGMAATFAGIAGDGLSRRAILAIILGLWALFYAGYWALVGF